MQSNHNHINAARRGAPLLLIALLALPVAGFAQEINLGASHTAGAGVDGAAGSVGIDEYTAEAGGEALSAGFAADDYSWEKSGNPGLLSSPWTHLTRINIDLAGVRSVNAHWSCFGGASIIAAFEKEPASYPNVEAAAGLQYDFTRTLSLRAGPLAFVQPADESVAPLVSLDWSDGNHTNSLWHLSMGFPESHMDYALNRNMTLLADLVFDSTLYRLADDSAVSKSGYFENMDTYSSLALDTSIARNIHLVFGASYTFSRSFILFDKHGDRLDTVNVASALGGFAQILYRL